MPRRVFTQPLLTIDLCEAQIVIGANDRQNQQILDLTFALDTFYSFVNISSVLVISIFLALSWFTGMRSRLTVVTFRYFALIATPYLLADRAVGRIPDTRPGFRHDVSADYTISN